MMAATKIIIAVGLRIAIVNNEPPSSVLGQPKPKGGVFLFSHHQILATQQEQQVTLLNAIDGNTQVQSILGTCTMSTPRFLFKGVASFGDQNLLKKLP
jgi:hypothetical protein